MNRNLNWVKGIEYKMDSENSLNRGDSLLAAKAGFWYVCGNFVGKAITFITTPIFARLMSPSDYGEFSNFASWAAMLLLIVGAELHNTLSRAYYDFKGKFDDYISTVTVLGGLITITTYVVFLFCRDFVFEIVAIPEQYVDILFFFLLFSFCREVYYARERTLYRYKTVAVITFFSLFLPTIISVFMVYFLPEFDQLAARLYGYYIPSAVIGMFCTITLFRKGLFFSWQYCKYALALAIPLLLHYLNAYLLTSTNIIITKNIAGAEAAAVVSIANSTTHILTVFFQATSGALTTWIMDNIELGEREKIKKGTFIYVLLLAAIIIITILFTPEVIQILGGKKYIASVSLLPGLAFATFVQSVTTVFTIILTYDKNVVKTAVYTGLFALASIIAKIILLPDYGLMVLVYVNITIFVSLFLINYFLIKKAGYANVVSFKQIISVIFFTAFFAILGPILYTWSGGRLLFIVLFVAGCIIAVGVNKNKIARCIKTVRKR